MLPIQLPQDPSDEHYRRYPLLFWAILAVASRRYPEDPALLDSLPPRVFALALQKLNAPSSGVYVVESLLLLLTWSFPSSEVSHETSFVLCASLVNLAMQLGLHTPRSTQDFGRTKVNLTDHDVKYRAQLW